MAAARWFRVSGVASGQQFASCSDTCRPQQLTPALLPPDDHPQRCAHQHLDGELQQVEPHHSHLTPTASAPRSAARGCSAAPSAPRTSAPQEGVDQLVHASPAPDCPPRMFTPCSSAKPMAPTSMARITRPGRQKACSRMPRNAISSPSPTSLISPPAARQWAAAAPVAPSATPQTPRPATRNTEARIRHSPSSSPAESP